MTVSLLLIFCVGDIAPTDISTARVYDLWQDPPQLLGEFTGNFTARAVAPHASMALRLDVVETTDGSDSDERSGDCSDVTTFGARGDSVTNDTAAIQLAIDTCAARKQTLVIGASVRTAAAAAAEERGGGGVYRIAALDLRSNLHMTIEAGAVLRADNDTDLWPKKSYQPSGSAPTLAPCRHIISGDSVRNVTIDGGGLIDGQGQAWWDLAHRMLRRKPPVKTDGLRPRMILCEDCTDFAVRGLRMLNSPSFHLYLSGFNCEVTGISIQSPNYGLAPNTDGIDVACGESTALYPLPLIFS